MRKIIFLTDHLNSYGGVCKVVSLLSNVLSKHVNVSILYRQNHKRSESVFELDQRISYQSLHFKPYSLVTSFEKIKGWFRLIKKLRVILRNESPEFIYSTGIVLSIISLISAFGFNTKIIVCDHTFHNAPGFPLRVLRFFLYRFAYSVIALTEQSKDFYESIGCNSEVIPNPTDFPLKTASDRLIRAKYNYKVVTSIGRLDTGKNYQELIEAWYQSKTRLNGWKLEIYGSGPDKEVLESLCRDSTITLMGERSNIIDILDKSSIYVSTSLVEGLPMSMIEAQTCLNPIVSYDCLTGPKDIVKKDCGYIVDVGDIKSFVKHLDMLTGDYDLYKSKVCGSEINANRYSLSVIEEKWLDLLNANK